MTGALQGIRVVEEGDGVMAAYCGRLFAELGADVVKVERPRTGSPIRYLPPFDPQSLAPESSGLFRALNLGKRGITLDSQTASGATVFGRLMEQTDILITERSATRGASEIAALRDQYPALVVVNVSHFGIDTAYEDWEATEIVTFNMGGLGYISPMASGRPEAPPLKASGHQSELQAAINGAIGALAALRGRAARGQGALVDVTAQESIIMVQEANTTSYTYDGVVRERSAPWLHQPVGLFPCKDGAVFIFIIGDRRWPELVEVMGTPEWTTWEVFKDGPSRALYFDALRPLMTEWTMQFTKHELYELLQSAKVPCSVFMEFPDLFESRQLKARGYWRTAEGETDPHIYAGPPFRISPAQPASLSRAPYLGEHTEEVLVGDLGLEPSDLDQLRRVGLV